VLVAGGASWGYAIFARRRGIELSGPAPRHVSHHAIAEVAAEIGAAVAFAEAGTFDPVEHLARFTYAETVS